MNEAQLWYFNIFDKSFNIKNKSKHIIPKSHKHKEKFGVVVKKMNLLNQTLIR